MSSLTLTVTPAERGILQLGVSPQLGIRVSPDEFLSLVAKQPSEVRITREHLLTCPIVGFAAVRRLVSVVVEEGTARIPWGSAQDLTWECFRSRKVPKSHPAVGACEAFDEHLVAAAISTLFDPVLWPSSPIDRVRLIDSISRQHAAHVCVIPRAVSLAVVRRVLREWTAAARSHG